MLAGFTIRSARKPAASFWLANSGDDKLMKHRAWNRYSSVDVGSAWQKNPSNQPSRRLKNRGSLTPLKIHLSRTRTRTVR
jgi:hypothetical protein